MTDAMYKQTLLPSIGGTKQTPHTYRWIVPNYAAISILIDPILLEDDLYKHVLVLDTKNTYRLDSTSPVTWSLVGGVSENVSPPSTPVDLTPIEKTLDQHTSSINSIESDVTDLKENLLLTNTTHASYVDQTDGTISALLEALDANISNINILSDRISVIDNKPPVEAPVVDIGGINTLSQRTQSLEDSFDDINTRLIELENAPTGEGSPYDDGPLLARLMLIESKVVNVTDKTLENSNALDGVLSNSLAVASKLNIIDSRLDELGTSVATINETLIFRQDLELLINQNNESIQTLNSKVLILEEQEPNTQGSYNDTAVKTRLSTLENNITNIYTLTDTLQFNITTVSNSLDKVILDVDNIKQRLIAAGI